MNRTFSAVVTKGEVAFVALCPELGVASQGKTEQSALKNLKEAMELYLEDEDVKERLSKNHFQKAKLSSIAVSI
ncbi:MAG: type II toxin-antitoxin system HicB family antitoxin [Candidatus Diapherotrites archaeon]